MAHSQRCRVEVDQLVLAGGIGESEPLVRILICEELKLLGITETQTAANEDVIFVEVSGVVVGVIHADEAWMMVHSVCHVCGHLLEKEHDHEKGCRNVLSISWEQRWLGVLSMPGSRVVCRIRGGALDAIEEEPRHRSSTRHYSSALPRATMPTRADRLLSAMRRSVAA